MFLVVPLILALIFPAASSAASPEEEYKKLQNKMTEQKRKLVETQQRESSVLTEIDTVNTKIEKTEKELTKSRQALRKTESEINAVNAEIARIRTALERQKEMIRRKLRGLQRLGPAADEIILLMSSADISQMMRTWKYLETVMRYEHRVMEGYQENIAALDEKSDRLRTLEIALKDNTRQMKIKENELSKIKRAKEVMLTSVRKEKAAHERMLSELREASRRMLEIIRESSRKDSYAASGFGRLKGNLSWPVEGRITLPYGSQKDPQFSTPIFRNGIHIETTPDAEARAVSTGKVIFAELFKGFGKLVIVNHGGGYHTLYGNLTEIFSHVGDIIKENQVIGRVGTSAMLNDHALYFEVRYKGKPLDPKQWLKSRRR